MSNPAIFISRKQRPWGIIIPCGVLIAIVLVAVVGPWLLPNSPTDFVSEGVFEAPSATAWLGTDYLGRDALARIVAGGRLTLSMTFAATVLAHAIGGTLGLLAAVIGGWFDNLLSRVVDVMLSLPKIIVGLVVVAALGPSIVLLVVVAGCVYSASVFRIARALGRDLVQQDFIIVARARGEGNAWILFGEMVPHVMRPLAADFALRMSYAILFISSLSFLGVGVQPPLADWGTIVKENISGLTLGSLVSLFAALAIALVSICANFLVDAIGDRQDRRD